MQNNVRDDGRNVVPRWRPLQATANWALQSSRSLDSPVLSSEDFHDDIQKWRRVRSIENAFDIYSTGLMTGDKALLWEGGLQILSNPNDIAQNVLDSVRAEIAPSASIKDIREKISSLEDSPKYVHFTIRLYKARLKDYPKDFSTNLDIARLYAIIGEHEKARHYIHIAVALAPDNRQALRALVQLYDVEGIVDQALPYLWRSETLRYDPLVQSAEIAAAELSGRGSRSAARAKKSLKGVKSVNISESELAMALATLEQRSGLSDRKVFQLVAAGLKQPTENALAQAVWLGEHSVRPIRKRFPHLVISDDAYEARAYMHFDAQRYQMALSSAYLWYRDQPFQAHPLSFICTTSAVYLDGDIQFATRFADAILEKHSNDWSALNCALLVYARTMNKNKAWKVVDIFSSLAESDASRAFLAAGQGLYHFTFGNIETGRSYYMSAMMIARKAKRPDLVFTAAAFYVVAEAKRGEATPFELGKAIDLLDKQVARLPISDKNDAVRVWTRSKEMILSEAKLPNDAQSLGSHILEGNLSLIPRLMEESR